MRKLATVVLLLFVAAFAEAQELGLASVYSPKFQSKFTANGESFSHSELTASHRKLPFGTMVKITRVDNGKMVIVRITDRGPFVNGYVTNLSKAAALKIGMLGETSETKVRMDIMNEPKQQLMAINTRPHHQRPEPIIDETVEVTSKSVQRSVPSEYRTVVPSPSSRFSPTLAQKKKVRL
jgi:rare lipoprotein A